VFFSTEKQGATMSEKSMVKRTIIPVFWVLLIALVSMTGYFASRAAGGGEWQSAFTMVLGISYFVSVAFGTLFVFSSATIGGAPMREKVLGSFVVPFAWATKEVLRLTESHPVSECLYWYVNPLNVWLVTLMTLEMGVATLIARWVLKRRGEADRVATPGPIAVIVGSLVFVIAAYAWGKGENIYVIFLSGYRLIFGSGV
jgi:hypothetical protein